MTSRPTDGGAPAGQDGGSQLSDQAGDRIETQGNPVGPSAESSLTARRMADAYGTSLYPQHAASLAASGISPARARARGYVSVDTKKRLETLGITAAGRNVPGLLVPSRRVVDGSVWGYQYRPDRPRARDGKPVKYETPVGQRNGLDVPPGVGPMLADPSVPLWITEGVKKADSAAEHGLCVVDLPGVWSWRGTNDKGGKTAIPDWHDVALNGRRVVLAFDSDVVVKRGVYLALDGLAEYLRSKGALVDYCHLPDDRPGKTGLDDYLMAGHDVTDLWTLVRPDPPEIRGEPAGSTGSTGSTGSIETPPGSDTEPETGRILDDVREHWATFVRTMSESDLDLLTLWTAHTHLVVETYTTPRLLLDSPMPGSGKTTCLEHMYRLAVAPVHMASVSSPALMTRMLNGGIRTLLIDEADRSLSPDKEGVGELLAVLNSGYKRGATRPVLVPTKEGWIPEEMPTFAPVAMAGNNPALPDDTRSRTIRVLLLPDLEGRVEESDWELIEAPARRLGERLARWADQVRDNVRTSERPSLPDGVVGRAKERWMPLKRVAVAAGGHWPDAVDDLARADLERAAQDREDGMTLDKPAVALLRHLFEVWPSGATFVGTNDLLGRLARHRPDMWSEGSGYGKDLTAQRMGRMLVQAFNQHSSRQGDGPRGYHRRDLVVLWRQMGVTPADALPQQSRAATMTTSTPTLPYETGGTDETGRTDGAATMTTSTPTLPYETDGTDTTGRTDDAPECRVCGNRALPNDPAGLCAENNQDHQSARRWAAVGVA